MKLLLSLLTFSFLLSAHALPTFKEIRNKFKDAKKPTKEELLSTDYSGDNCVVTDKDSGTRKLPFEFKFEDFGSESYIRYLSVHPNDIRNGSTVLVNGYKFKEAIQIVPQDNGQGGIWISSYRVGDNGKSLIVERGATFQFYPLDAIILPKENFFTITKIRDIKFVGSAYFYCKID